MLTASLGFPYIPFKTETIHKGVCDGKVSLKIVVEKSEVRGPLGRSGLRYKDNTGSSKKMEGIYNRYNLKSTRLKPSNKKL